MLERKITFLHKTELDGCEFKGRSNKPEGAKKNRSKRGIIMRFTIILHGIG